MRVVVECYHDTALARALGVPRERMGHERGKGNVLNSLARWDGPAVGIVDEDPGKQASNPREMASYRTVDAAHGLARMRHAADERKGLIVVSPVLEEWLVARAGAAGLDLAAYGLPETARELHRRPRFDRKPGFQRFLADLTVDDGMQTLRRWLTP